MPQPSWIVVVPVKDASRGKTRLAGALDPAERVALVRAMATDTVDAALACAAVRAVILVTDDPVLTQESKGRARLWVEADPGTVPGDRDGLNRAIRHGSALARRTDPGGSVAVLLGDLPMLAPAELGAALAAASARSRAMVADEGGTGTTLLAVGPGIDLSPRFGPGSAAAHRALGHQDLDLPVGSTVRADVDLPDDVTRLDRARLGAHTAAVLGEAGQPGRA